MRLYEVVEAEVGDGLRAFVGRKLLEGHPRIVRVHGCLPGLELGNDARLSNVLEINPRCARGGDERVVA